MRRCPSTGGTTPIFGSRKLPSLTLWHLLALMCLAAGCAYPTQRGTWSGRVVATHGIGADGSVYQVAGLAIEEGTQVPDPYRGSIPSMPADLVDSEHRALSLDAAGGEGARVQVTGEMSFGVVRSPDGSTYLAGMKESAVSPLPPGGFPIR